MTMSTQPQSAVIYDFTAIARERAQAREHAVPTPLPAAEPLPTVACGSGWYHEAAIEEAERSRKQ